MANTLYNTSKLNSTFQFTYMGPPLTGTMFPTTGLALIGWLAIVDSAGNIVAGPDSTHKATSAGGIVSVVNGQAVSILAIMVNNGSIPSGSYGVVCKVFLGDFATLLGQVSFPVGTIVVVEQAVTAPTVTFTVT